MPDPQPPPDPHLPDPPVADEPEGYRTEQFAFVHEQAPPEEPGWLTFGDSRAGRRADRRERFRDKIVLVGAVLALCAVVAGLLVWRPWSSSGPADTGEDVLGADRVSVLLQLADGDGGALFSAVLQHDRRAGGRGAAVVVPADLVLPVAGEATLTVRSALDAAGPTRSREALAALLGLDLSGSWVLDRGAFAGLVDRLGGIADPAGPTGGRLDGQAALTRVSDAAAVPGVLGALGAAFPPTFTGSRDALVGTGILDSPGLPVDSLGAVVAGLARDAAAGRLGVAALPLEQGSRNLDLAAALPIVRDTLGGVQGAGRGEDVTPRVLVRLAPGAPGSAADVRADIVNAGYEYVDGGVAAPGAATSVLVRTGIADAQALGESVAKTLGLPTSAVRVADDVPFVADVAVVVGPA